MAVVSSSLLTVNDSSQPHRLPFQRHGVIEPDEDPLVLFPPAGLKIGAVEVGAAASAT